MSLPNLLSCASKRAADSPVGHARPFDAKGAEGTAGTPRIPDGEAPLLIHFDVNKTILQTDSIQLKDAEDGVREGIAELFWGSVRTDGDKTVWEWTRSKPSCLPPTDDIRTAGDSFVNYAQFCKSTVKDKAARKEAVKTFSLVDAFAKQEMNKQLQLAMKKMQLPPEFRGSPQVEAAGVKGMTYNAFPSLFHLVANLQRSRRTFAILFRSFGVDHEKVQAEWNAFCELRHPIFSRLIEDIGPMDGSVLGVPDRRVHTLHTLYRDAAGPMLVLDTLTNGPADATWDAWARQNPPAKADTRNGREYVQKVLRAKTADGILGLQKWMGKQLLHQRTAAIKDDWAWWTFKKEQASAGKLVTLIGGRRPTRQLFLDDNIEHNDARIVDVRDAKGHPMPQRETLGKICIKVNPVEAILDNDYFLWKLIRAQGEGLNMGSSALMGLQKKKLVEVESQNNVLQDQLTVSNGQVKLLVEEMRRMRLQRRIAVRNEGELQTLLGKHSADVAAFGQGGYRSVSDLFAELEAGRCWLEVDEHGQLVRVLDMVFFKLCFKDMLLIETHEEDSSGRMSTRNFLPGLVTTVNEVSVQQQIERWLESGLQVNLQKCVDGDLLPMYVPDAPNQQTGSTKAYPLRCKVQQSRATLSIPEKEVEINKDAIRQIGLPSGQRFRTVETDLHGSTTARFWRWDKIAVWEASSGLAAGGAEGAPKMDQGELCDKLFRGSPRKDAYKRLLLEMFETFESFDAQMLTGGFGGSAVVRVQPYERDGRPSEPCVVKLDTGKLIRDEFQKSVNVFAALPDRAARILGDPVFSASEEFGAMRLELAGACWNNPELAQGSSSSNLLSTFKDLLLYESEQALLGVGSSSAAAENRPFGNVNSVIAETFGPGGVVSSLRKGDKGLHRSEGTSLLWGWYTLKGKPGPFNPYTAAKGDYPAEPAMRRLYKEYFRTELPSMKDLGIDAIKEKLVNLAGQGGKELAPLVGLAHGDLNAANIMIDASDALWMIDFATSVDLPLFTDMCKFEMACLFEYATIPITPKMLVEFAGTQESLWQTMNVGDWLRTDQAVVMKLLQKFVALPPERLTSLSQGDLEQLIDEVVKRTGKSPDKQHKMERSLKSRLVADEAMVAAAFSYCSSVSNALLCGDTLGETLNVSSIPIPEGRGGRGALSLKLLMDHCVAVRRFMRQDVVGCLRARAGAQADLQPCDWMSLQLYLPFLRESYRIIGYRDVAPQYKIWAIYHCSKLAQCVQHSLGVISKNARKLEKAGYMSSLKAETESSVRKRRTEKPRLSSGSGVPECISAEMFEEETERFKQTLRARLSFVIDPLSGDRLSVRECAPLSLTQLGSLFGGKSPRVVGPTGSAQSEEGAAVGAKVPEGRQGWANIMGVAERLDKGEPSDTPSSFLVLGPPGSGKTCLVHRLVMEVLDRYTHVVPLLLPVADLAKRSSQDPELCMSGKNQQVDPEAVDQWFDRYLRITFGEESHRYLMICQAIRTNRAMFIFEGLEDCGELKPIIECCIQRQILQQRMVVVTSRPLIGGQSSLEHIQESIVAMNVESLTEEHIRMVAHARLGLSGFEAFERIFAKVRGGGGGEEVADVGGPHADQGEGSKGKPEVFGNPMMLSMLLCYLQTMKRKEAEKREAQRRGQADDNDDDGEGTNVTAIYRVAIDVMLMRMQRRQMADRLNQQEELDRWKQIVEVVALHMALRGLDSITAAEAEALLRGQLRREWPGLKKAVVAGHAMFLRVTDGAREEMQFLAKDFLSFFAASAVARGGGYELPGITQLFSDPAWAQMLEMLSEAWPLQYVKVVEHRLGSFRGEGGDTFLHAAARAGHRPAFQSLRLFSDRQRKALKVQNQDLQTPLHVAAEKGYTRLCALMLESGAPLEALDSKERLAIHVAMQHGNFQTAKFLTQHWSRQEHLAAQIYSRRSRGHVDQLASRVLGELSGRSAPEAAEKDFLETVDSLFMELGYFGKNEADVRKSTQCALLAVFWVAANHHALFVRGQPEGVRLTSPSWEKLQEWAKKTVRLTGSTMLSTTMVFVAIMNLSRIKSFRQAFAPDVDEPDEALAGILQKSPVLVPSFMKLEEHQRQAILSALKANFNFGQFLQAENLPGNLSAAKQILMKSGNTSGSVNTLGLFLFRNFAALSGLRGKDSLEGSLFMTDTFYSNYKVGLDVLKHLMSESAQQVYERFLKERARAQALSFYPHDPESRARVRLACLTRVFDAEGGKEVSAALASMEPGRRRSLIHFLNADGISQKPGFLLYFAPQVLANARKNPSIGLALGLEMLLSVYEAAAREYVDSEQVVVTIMLPELVERALSCTDAESFRCAKFEIARTSESVGTLRMSPWQVCNDPDTLEHLSVDARALVDGVLGSKTREPIFLKKLPQAFPELQFFSGEESAAQRAALRETQLALLTVYWTASDQLESFNRGQEASVKLSAKSWGKIRQLAGRSMLTDPEALDALLVAMALHNLGRIPKLGAQLAADANSHRHVIAQILDSSPKVLPSYWRLSPRYRKVVHCLLSFRLFNFQQFLDAESVPANITTIKEMLSGADCAGELASGQILRLFTFMVFIEMSAASAEQSLEGSLCMTERLWLELEVGLSALGIMRSEGEVAIYNRSLELHCRMLELDFDVASQESRAAARVARLAAATSPGLAARVREAFCQLAWAERSALAKYLTADGITVKPGFVLAGGRALLSNALSNEQVGILPALRILLQVYREAERHFRWSSCAVLTIDLVKLAVFTQDFAGSVTFQEISFDLVKSGSTEVVVVPKVWIPVRNPSVLNTLRMQSRELASDVLANKISEAQFKARLDRTFPELSYFNAGDSEQLSKTICAMMSVYWFVTGQHEAFIRGQGDSELLSRQSWSWIQGWMKQSVRLMSEETLDAMLTFVAISALGTIPEFREEFAPKASAHIQDGVLAHVLETKPEVLPSFQRLDARYKGLISDCLRVNFRFSEFLMAESVPADLAHVKASMEPYGEEGIGFFCFRIFSRACGKLGSRHLWGSQFMTESQFQRFRPGFEALQQLRALDAGAAYNNYLLLLQGSKALACFTSPEHQALTRLLCLESANGEASESDVSEAFKELHPHERERLTKFLTADGLGARHGYVLRGAPELLKAACSNPRVGAAAVLRTLLRVQDKCSVGSRVRKVHLDLHGLAAAARDAPGSKDFMQVPLDLQYDDQGDTRVCVVTVAGSGSGLVRPAGRSRRHTVTGLAAAREEGSDGGSLFWRLFSGMSCRGAPMVNAEREDA